MMLFKSWGYMLMANGLTFVQDMKVGHYVSTAIAISRAFRIVKLQQLIGRATDESASPIHVPRPAIRRCLAVDCPNCYFQFPRR